MTQLPSSKENPNGLHKKYEIRKSDGKACSEDADYFTLRLDDDPDDPQHISACRKALAVYIEEIKDHLPILAAELKERYGHLLNFNQNHKQN